MAATTPASLDLKVTTLPEIEAVAVLTSPSVEAPARGGSEPRPRQGTETVEDWTGNVPLLEQRRLHRKRMIILGSIILALLALSLIVSSGKQGERVENGAVSPSLDRPQETAPGAPKAPGAIEQSPAGFEPRFVFSCPQGSVVVRAEAQSGDAASRYVVELGPGCEAKKGLEAEVRVAAAEDPGSEAKAKPQVRFKRGKPPKAKAQRSRRGSSARPR